MPLRSNRRAMPRNLLMCGSVSVSDSPHSHGGYRCERVVNAVFARNGKIYARALFARKVKCAHAVAVLHVGRAIRAVGRRAEINGVFSQSAAQRVVAVDDNFFAVCAKLFIRVYKLGFVPVKIGVVVPDVEHHADVGR